MWKNELIQNINFQLKALVEKHFYKQSCSWKEAKFLLSNLEKYKISHFYIIWKILKNPIIGRPIVAGYNWILTPASIFVEHFLKAFYSKFDAILTDSVSLIRILENTEFKWDCLLFAVDFKSLYTSIPVEDAIAMIPNAHLILMSFDKEYFEQIFGIIMGANFAPILANIYMALLENELRNKCTVVTLISNGQDC